MTNVSLNRLIQLRLKSMIEDNTASVKIDSRTPIVHEKLPSEGFQIKKYPAIAIEKPTHLSRSPYSSDHIREEFEVVIVIYDKKNMTYKGMLETEERVELLTRNVARVIEGNIYPGFKDLSVFKNFIQINYGQTQELASNIYSQEMTVLIPAVYRSNATFSV